jgi:hypothetical protein
MRGIAQKEKGSALVDVHSDLSKLQRRNPNHRKTRKRRHRRPNLVVEPQSHLVRKHDGSDGIDPIERRCTSECNENLPRRENVATGDLDGGSGEGFLRLLVRDDLGGDEDGSVEDDARQCENPPNGEEGEAVAEEEEGAPPRPTDGIDLVVLQTEVTEEGVVVPDALFELLDARVVFVDFVTDDETLVEFDDLTEGEVLPGRTVETAGGLNELREGREVSSEGRKEWQERRKSAPSKSRNPAHEPSRSSTHPQ